jgi:hypothetical protein
MPEPQSGPPITYLPNDVAFVPSSMDVFTGTGTIPPPAGNKRTTAASCLVCGTFLEGSRNRQQAGFGYTHVILCDPNLEIRDGYTQDTSAPTATIQDVLQMPTASTNYWVVIFSFVAEIPALGRRKIILADRRTPVGSWPNLL